MTLHKTWTDNSRNRTVKHWACCVAVLTVSVLASGCKPPAKAAATSNAVANPLEIKVSPALRRGITIGSPQQRELTATLQVPARVETDATRVARIGSPVDGRITKLLVLEGQHVRRGQALATLHSTTLSDAQFSFLKAYSQRNLAEKSIDRAKQLMAADVIGSAELQRRQAEEMQASAETAALSQQLHLLGMSDGAIHRLETTHKLNSEYFVNSSVDGTVLERKVTIGQIVQPAEEAFLVADLSRVWLVANVPEESASELRVGKQIEAHIPALPDAKITGRISFVSSIVDPATRTIATRVDLSNADGRYKPAMLAGMMIQDAPKMRVVVPATAVVREDNTDHLFVQTAENTFVLREVTLGAEYGEVRVLEKGVHPGEKIVLTGAFGLNNQRKQNLISGGR